MSAAVIIPARMGSTRLPGKVLAPLRNKPLIQHVYERSLQSSLASEVIVATDSAEVMAAVLGFGGRAVMTSASHPSGTDRVAEAAGGISADIIVNVQGDEPMIRPEVIDQVIELLERDPGAHMSTVARRIDTEHDAASPNVVKVAFAPNGRALYFSRSPIPYHRDQWAASGVALGEGVALYKHIGIYGYRREALMRLSSLLPTPLELAEKLEQLRALEHGMVIQVGITEFESMGVDTPDDLERVEKCLSSSS